MKANFYLNTPRSGQHQLDIEDAPEVWGLPDDTYDVNVLDRTAHYIQFQILGGEHDGKTFAIVKTIASHNE